MASEDVKAKAVATADTAPKNTIWKAIKPFVNGGASGMLATCVIQPVDMVKVRLQLGATGSPVRPPVSVPLPPPVLQFPRTRSRASTISPQLITSCIRPCSASTGGSAVRLAAGQAAHPHRASLRCTANASSYLW